MTPAAVPTPLLLRGARIADLDAGVTPARRVDVVLVDGRIRDIGPAGAVASPAGADLVDLDGAVLVPGLWDHHVHLDQWASAAERVDVSAASSPAEAVALLLAGAAPGAAIVVGQGYRDVLWSTHPERADLDAAFPERPVAVLSGDVHAVWLNAAGLAAFGLDPAGPGVIREWDAFDLIRRLDDVSEAEGDRRVGSALAAAGRRGIVGVVDFEMAWNHGSWARRVAAGFDLARVEYGVYPGDLDRAIADGLRTAEPLDAAGLVRTGRLKVISDGSMNLRTACCAEPYGGEGEPTSGVLSVEPAALVRLLERAAAAGLESSVHAIGDLAVGAALDAFEASGARGTIEHAQLVADADVERFARLGVAASVQPAHLVDDRDAADVLWPGRTRRAFPLAALLAAGAELRFGSDAPVAPLDPWRASAAAVTRTVPGRRPWHPEHRVAVAAAIRASAHRPERRVAPGEPGDLAVLAADPFVVDAATLGELPVHGVVVGGRARLG